jgi:hypothetical protein
MSYDAVSQDTGATSAEPTAPGIPDSFSSVSEAAAFLGRHAAAKRKESAAPVTAAADEPEQPVSGDEPGEEPAVEAAPAQEETQETEPALPAIEPPASWPKEEKEAFNQLPRQLQEIVSRREQDRDRHFTKGQQETAEQRKAIQTEKQQAEQLRQQYEAQLPVVAQALHQALIAEFPDVKTMEDVQRLAREDWPRYVQWDAKQKQLAQWKSEADAAHQRQQQEANAQLADWVKSQDAEIEREFSNVPPTEQTAIANKAKDLLIDYGFSEDQLGNLWNSSILRSAPMQRILADAARYNIAKANAAKPAAKPVPPVQRPGNAVRAPNHALETQIAALEAKPSLSLKEATQLMSLKGQRGKAA